LIISFVEVNDMAKITKDNVLHTAELAVIAISEEEAEKYSEHLSNLLATTEKIQNINKDSVKTTIYGNNNDNVLSKDEPKRKITQEEALKNAPEEKDCKFEVPSIME